MSDPKKRPSPLWLFFYGRKRQGFPWLLVVLMVGLVALGLTFAIPGGADMWRAVAPAIFGLLIVGALVAAIAAVFRPRRRR